MRNKYYSIHDLLNIEILSQNAKFIKSIENRYNYFSTNKLSNVDIRVMVAPFNYCPEGNTVKKGNYYIGSDGIWWKDNRKLANWKVFIKGLEAETIEIYFWGNCISFKYLFFNVLEPLINIRLVLKGYVLLHSSAVMLSEKVYLFCSYPGVGKSSFALNLLGKGTYFLSDELTILSKKSEVFSFPLPIALYDYNINGNNEYKNRLSNKDRLFLKIRKLLRVLTKNYIKPPIYINVKKLFPESKTTPKGILGKFYILSKKNDGTILPSDINEFSNEIMDINHKQFRYFHRVLSFYLSVNRKSKLRFIDRKQKEILSSVLRNRKFGKIYVEKDFTFKKTDIINLLTLKEREIA